MGMCDPGDQILLKIQSARNHFKSNRSVGLIVTNLTQLIWVQTDIGSERYRILFKMTNRQKKGCWLYSLYSPYGCWRGRSYDTWQAVVWIVGIWRGLFVANGMATHGPINGRHVSPIYWFKIYLESTGFDPVTSTHMQSFGKDHQPTCHHSVS